ncbi:uncharacterized protein si:dkeyp-55f12.3 [Danio aesculapii]|uniref:uncharacterized protein si:dkeyp-55f12.3 n=1 Tax=Danio aesculapii TaxID=1142201 RepID=UPI0024BF5D5D|nr:uncharacterized protein si:dkeyp-55f12.3 [Danio aesculapii]
MAACELKGELKYRDGHTNPFTVQVDGNLKSIISGIKKINGDISEALTALVEQEKGSTGNGREDVNDDEEEDSDDDDGSATETTTAKKSGSEPPNKKIKTLRS